MQHLVCYDIADDQRRSRVAKALLDFGKRVQESVFMAELDEELLEKLEERLRRTIDVYCDSVLIVTLCGACESRSRTMGVVEIPRDEAFYVV